MMMITKEIRNSSIKSIRSILKIYQKKMKIERKKKKQNYDEK